VEGRSVGATIARAWEYATATRRSLRPRYAFVYLTAHLLPAFTCGPLIARLYQ
jgi:hypothetical protein